MSKITQNFNLVMPEVDEFYDSWGEVLNANTLKIDTELGKVLSEIINARGSAASLKARLDRGSEPNGDLKPSPEVAKARSSAVYGYADGNAEFDLDSRIENSELEILQARQGLMTLEDSVAWANTSVKDTVNSAPSNYITYSGPDIKINTSLPVVMNINGFRHVQAADKTIVVSGAANNYFLYAEKSANGQIITSNPASTGQTSIYGTTTKISKFAASSVNFITAGVKVKHILNITGPVGNANIGKYIIEATSSEDIDLPPNALKIVGEFPSALTDLEYEIVDPVQASYSYSSVPHPKTYQSMDGKIALGRFSFDGANIISLKAYALNGKYEGWFPVNLSAGFVNLSIEHNLGYIPRSIKLYASQSNDFSQPLEPIGISEAAGSGVANHRGFVVRTTDMLTEMRNATSGVFYKDFAGVTQTSGYLYVIIER